MTAQPSPSITALPVAPKLGTTLVWTLNILPTIESAQEKRIKTAQYLQELLWTIEGVETIEERYRKNVEDVLDYLLDGVNMLAHLEAVLVFSSQPEVEDGILALLSRDDALNQAGWAITARQEISQEDWAESWKQHWEITRIHDRLIICPNWKTPSENNPALLPTPNDMILKLDPGSAFGTGTHATTCLMLQGIEQHAQRVDFSTIATLDVGTGSGILAVYSALLGCRSVMGIDNDPYSLPAAISNAELNQVAEHCQFSLTPLQALCQTRHELVLANIIAPVIITLLPEIKLRLTPGGLLMLSGLIDKNLPDVISALQQHGLSDYQTRQQGDWYALDVTAPD